MATAHQPGAGRAAALRSELMAARRMTDELFGVVAPGAIYDRPIPERHRLIFYLGHLEAFDWNLMARRGLGLPPFHPAFDELFAFGIDPGPDALPADVPADWPAREAVEEYNRETRRLLDSGLDAVPEEMLDTAIEHRLMHAETFAYLLHNLPLEGKRPPRPPSVLSAGATPRQEMIRIPAGPATLGLRQGEPFGWDNEFERHEVDVPAFLIGRHKITNGDYLEFVRSGGPVPYYWVKANGDWELRTMFGREPLPLNHPVYVTQQQAESYAAWAGCSIPSEAQWHRAALGTPGGGERKFPWGDEPPGRSRGNFDFHHWDTQPVDATPAGDSAFGVSQMVGNGWEWTATPFGPFPGFRARPYYPAYSAGFFDNAHFVMKGGSPRTAARLLRPSFRNWFRADYPYVYATFRCVRSVD